MKVLVCGSRSLDNEATEIAVCQRLHELPPRSEILHGGATGPDIFAYRAALVLDHIGRAFLPDWRRDGKRAGIVRNLRMLDREPDLVIAWWDGESRGTAHTITEARRRGIPVEVHEPSGHEAGHR